MINIIVADNFTIINTQGIRFVERIDTNYSVGSIKYRLDVTYKGDKMQFAYAKQEDRDNQFEQLRKAMVRVW